MGYIAYLIITIIEIFIFYKLFLFIFTKIDYLDEKYNRQKNENYSNNENNEKNKELDIKEEIPICFQILGFTKIPDDEEEVKTRYKKLTKIYHPDMGGTEEEFSRINNAYKEAMLLLKNK